MTTEYQREWISFEDAENCASLNSLIGALKDGTIRARGRFTSEMDAYTASSPEEIEQKYWYEAVFAQNLNGENKKPYELEWIDETEPNRTLCWFKDIELFISDLEKIGGKVPNKGGSPQKFNEKRFYVELAALINYGKVIPNEGMPWIDSEKRKEIYSLMPMLIEFDSNTTSRKNLVDIDRIQASELPQDNQVSPSDKTVRNYLNNFFAIYKEAEKIILKAEKEV